MAIRVPFDIEGSVTVSDAKKDVAENNWKYTIGAVVLLEAQVRRARQAVELCKEALDAAVATLEEEEDALRAARDVAALQKERDALLGQQVRLGRASRSLKALRARYGSRRRRLGKKIQQSTQKKAKPSSAAKSKGRSKKSPKKGKRSKYATK
jgi:hypothetical protein